MGRWWWSLGNAHITEIGPREPDSLYAPPPHLLHGNHGVQAAQGGSHGSRGCFWPYLRAIWAPTFSPKQSRFSTCQRHNLVGIWRSVSPLGGQCCSLLRGLSCNFLVKQAYAPWLVMLNNVGFPLLLSFISKYLAIYANITTYNFKKNLPTVMTYIQFPL